MPPRENVSVRLDREKREALDRLAKSMDRDCTYLINEAVDAYLQIHAWQLEEIRTGFKEADAGRFASDEEVAQAFSRCHT